MLFLISCENEGIIILQYLLVLVFDWLWMVERYGLRPTSSPYLPLVEVHR
jgi:hypothetical protein